nr:hypothetical protein [uncultured Prevotella sp.]
MKKNKLLWLFELVIFLDMINGAYPWFFWNVKASYLNLLFAVISILYLKINGIKLQMSNYGVGLLLLFASTFFNVNSASVSERISQLLFFVPIWVLTCDVRNSQRIFTMVAKWLSILLVPSIILHLLFLAIGFPPSVIIINENAPDYYVFFNYFFLIQYIVMEDSQIRFCSIFLEPGYIGTLLSFLLYVGKFDFKKRYNLILLVALVLTLSLAGFVVSAMGWVFIKLQEGKSIKQLFYILAVLGSIYWGGISYNGGRNVLNEKILSRLQYDEDKGISGNNRTSHLADAYFEQYTNNGQILFGVGNQTIRKINGGSTKGANFNDQIRGAGYKIFFMRNGIVQALIILIGYMYIMRKSNRKYSVCFLLLIIITFIQASYPLSSSWLIPFVFGCLLNKKKYENRNTNISSCS